MLWGRHRSSKYDLEGQSIFPVTCLIALAFAIALWSDYGLSWLSVLDGRFGVLDGWASYGLSRLLGFFDFFGGLRLRLPQLDWSFFKGDGLLDFWREDLFWSWVFWRLDSLLWLWWISMSCLAGWNHLHWHLTVIFKSWSLEFSSMLLYGLRPDVIIHKVKCIAVQLDLLTMSWIGSRNVGVQSINLALLTIVKP